MLYQNRASFEGTTTFADGTAVDMDNMILPFVSFEGDTRFFAIDPDYAVPLLLRGTTLDEDLNDPFTRLNNGNAAALDAMVSRKLADPAYSARFANVVSSNDLREYLAQRIGSLQAASGVLPNVLEAGDAANLGIGQGTALSYPAKVHRMECWRRTR